MSQTTVSIRMDDHLKKQLDSLCYDFGMTMSTAFTIFARTIVRERRFPLDIRASEDPFYSEVNQARLRESIAQIESGKGLIVKTWDELMAMEDA